MASVEVSELLHTSIGDVWNLVTDLRAYPNLMEPVRSIHILDEGSSSDGTTWVLSEWEVELKGSILRWTEREIKDPRLFRVEYKQVDGDLDEFSGHWQLEVVSAHETLARLVVHFEIGIPLLRDMLEPVAEHAVEQNSIQMLRSLEPIHIPSQ